MHYGLMHLLAGAIQPVSGTQNTAQFANEGGFAALFALIQEEGLNESGLLPDEAFLAGRAALLAQARKEGAWPILAQAAPPDAEAEGEAAGAAGDWRIAPVAGEAGALTEGLTVLLRQDAASWGKPPEGAATPGTAVAEETLPSAKQSGNGQVAQTRPEISGARLLESGGTPPPESLLRAALAHGGAGSAVPQGRGTPAAQDGADGNAETRLAESHERIAAKTEDAAGARALAIKQALAAREANARHATAESVAEQGEASARTRWLGNRAAFDVGAFASAEEPDAAAARARELLDAIALRRDAGILATREDARAAMPEIVARAMRAAETAETPAPREGAPLQTASAPAGAAQDPQTAVRAQETAPPERPMPQSTLPQLPAATLKHVRFLLASGEQRATVKLIPESLGEVRIDILKQGDQIQVRLLSANPAVRELLEGQLAGLRESFQRDGLHLNRVDVGGQTLSNGAGPSAGHHEPGAQKPQYGGGAHGAPGNGTTSEPPEAPRRVFTAHRGSLNLLA